MLSSSSFQHEGSSQSDTRSIDSHSFRAPKQSSSRSFTFNGIDHVQLAAPEGSEAEARAFFGGLLGWAEIPKPVSLQQRGGVWFQCGSHQIHIGVQQLFTPAAKAHPAFQVNGLQALRQHLHHNGVQITEDDARAEEGAERFYVKDPYGNRLEFIEWGN